MHRVHLTFLVTGDSAEAWKLAGDLEVRFSKLAEAGKAFAVTAWVETEGREPAAGTKSAESHFPQDRSRVTSVGDVQVRKP